MFKPDPKAKQGLLFSISQDAETIKQGSCKNNVFKRVKHKLVINNNCFSVKHKFDIAYTVDSNYVKICDDYLPEKCDGGSDNSNAALPVNIRVPYWKGETKHIIKYLCWIATENEQDFNLSISINWRGISKNRIGSNPRNWEEEINLNLYGNRKWFHAD